MARLIVNPGREGAWEIPLRDGVTSLGRGEHNHFQINEPSVSTSHCHILVNDGDITIKDLGSTNGTFVNQARVTETHLQPGQRLRLGGVEILLEADVPESAPPPPVPATGGLRIAPRAAEPPPQPEAPPIPPPLVVAQHREFPFPAASCSANFIPSRLRVTSVTSATARFANCASPRGMPAAWSKKPAGLAAWNVYPW